MKYFAFIYNVDSLYYCKKHTKNNLQRFIYQDRKWEWKRTRSFTILMYNSPYMIKEICLWEALLSVRQNNLKNWSCWQDDTSILKQVSGFWNYFFFHIVLKHLFFWWTTWILDSCLKAPISPFQGKKKKYIILQCWQNRIVGYNLG